jgi:hypothetical protein
LVHHGSATKKIEPVQIVRTPTSDNAITRQVESVAAVAKGSVFDTIRDSPLNVATGGTILVPSKSPSAVCLILVTASSLGLFKDRAEISEVQPFTALETHITRGIHMKVPNVGASILAVSGDGQLIATLSRSDLPGRPVYNRTVWNKKEKTKISIDPEFKMLIVYPYYEPVYLNGGNSYVEDGHLTWGPNCEGTPDGQIEGFDVYRTEPLFGEDASNPGGSTTEKRWAAPRLGCYVLRDEELKTDRDGNFVWSNTHTLTDVKIGEPDPSYFDTSLPEGYTQVTPEEWKDTYINRMRAMQAIREHQQRPQ